ncbi:hypothetical protein [Streptomyces sp. NPDC101234]|uniref:hypothetical protein n=1 Tax=Streptomyces sp. NPDC101234 TaxID=3366138 RepID=UPI0037FF47C8
MGEIEDTLDRTGQEQFTREPPKTVKGRVDFLVRQLGTTRGDGTTATINELSRCGFCRPLAAQRSRRWSSWIPGHARRRSLDTGEKRPRAGTPVA